LYHQHFGFSEEPFGVSPDPRFLFSTAQHAEAAASIHFAIMNRRGFVALIAPPGLGKTSVISSLLERLQLEADVVLLVHPELGGTALIESVLIGLGIDPSQDHALRMRQLADHLHTLDLRRRTCVVILDEAQNLSAAALESVRMLSNFERPGSKLIQFVLVGQPALTDLLSQPNCEQIRQRIGMIARLRPLTSEEVGAYIEHRVSVASSRQQPFTENAVRTIATASGGVPRIVNALCFNALTVAFAQDHKTVTEADAAEAVADFSLPSDPSSSVFEEPVLKFPAAAVSPRSSGLPRFQLNFMQTAIFLVMVGLLLFGAAVAGFATGSRPVHSTLKSHKANALVLNAGEKQP
jgi:general secretion pathway protein A